MDYLKALEVIWTRPQAPGRFYLASAPRLAKSSSTDEFLKETLLSDDYQGFYRPIHLYLTDLEECFVGGKEGGLIKPFVYRSVHQKLGHPLLQTSFLFCDQVFRESKDKERDLTHLSNQMQSMPWFSQAHLQNLESKAHLEKMEE